MIDWRLVLAAFLGGLGFALGAAAWRERRNARVSLRLAAGMAAALAAMALAINPARAAVAAEAGQTRASPARLLAEIAAPLASAFPGVEAPPAAGRAFAERIIPPEPVADAIPPRLIIPSLNIDENIVPIHIRDGQWDLENLGTGVGWLETTGARPGDSLAMVLAGHMTLTGAERGAFAYLQTIERGASVIYRFGDMEYIYAVTDKGRLPPGAVEPLYVADGRVLLLMTCTDWDSASRTYANRLWVRAALAAQSAADEPGQ
jgi:LPXTG-site transpeptidase (sortase) family protein